MDGSNSHSTPRVESMKVHVSDFGTYVEEQHANGNKGFRDQYYVSRVALNICKNILEIQVHVNCITLVSE